MTPDAIDIHSHIYFDEYKEDRDEVMKNSLDNGIWSIQVGVDYGSSEKAVSLAEKYEKSVYATVGLHPTNAVRQQSREVNREETLDQIMYYEHFLDSKKVVAIGECGLDYYRVDKNTKEIQVNAFTKQIGLANEHNLPLMLHIRPSSGTFDAYEDAIQIIKEHAKIKGNVHFFVGDKDIAKKFLDLGFSLSFTGVITFAKDYDEVIEYLPIESILSETDSPYVAPIPNRGKRNEPAYVLEVVRRISEIKKISFEEIKKQLVKNAISVFNLV